MSDSRTPPIDPSLQKTAEQTPEHRDSKLFAVPWSEASIQIPRYKILRQLGDGGMGTVYLAQDTMLDRDVALKIIKLDRGVSESTLNRFRIEAKALAKIQHPHIIQIFDFGEWQPTADSIPLPYFTMEYAPSGSLVDVIKKRLLHPMEAAGLVEVLALAVHVAHEVGVIHRDLKPQNILLRNRVAGTSGNFEFGMPKITDFGLARQIDATHHPTLDGQMMGTPAYMSPEQADGSPNIDAETDVWALGIILYECITGQLPFHASSLISLAKKIAFEPAPSIRDKVPDCPVELEVIYKKCLEKEPKQRYRTAKELANELRKVQGPTLSGAGPVPTWGMIYSRRGDTQPTTMESADTVPTEPLAPTRRAPGANWKHAGPAAKKSRTPLGIFFLLFLLLLGLILWFVFFRNPSADSTSQEELPKTYKPAALAKSGELDLFVYEAKDESLDGFKAGNPNRQGRRLYDRNTLPLRPKDWIRLEAKVDQPSYLYLIWIDTEGKATPLWPWKSIDENRNPIWTDPREEEEPRTSVLLPDPKTGFNIMPMSFTKAGLETILLLARTTPLTDKECIELGQKLDQATNLQIPLDNPQTLLWLQNGERDGLANTRAPVVNKSSNTQPEIPTPIQNKAARMEDLDVPIRDLMKQLQPWFPYSRAVLFGNQGKTTVGDQP